MGRYYMGIDGGTGSMRAAIFDIDGNMLGNAVVDYPTTYPKPGWAEQSEKDWDKAMMESIPAAIKEAGITPEEVVAVAVDATTATVCFVDENIEMTRTPLLWMDVRAVDEARGVDATGHDNNRFYPAGLSAETTIAKALWVRNNEFEVYQKTKYIIEYCDWVNYQLTGELVLNFSAAAIRGLYDKPNGGYREDYYKAIGIPDLKDKMLDKHAMFGEKIGEVTAEAAAKYGLAEGTMVVEGGVDACACQIGVGVVNDGEVALIAGTSNVLFANSPIEFHTKGVNGAYIDAVFEGSNLIEGGQNSAGSIIEWFVRNICPGEWKEDAKAKGMSIYDYFTSKAAEIPIGCEGLYMLDYFQGNRVPHADSAARGMMCGLSLQHTTAHIARAILEAISYGIGHCLKVWQDNDFKVGRVVACGGITNSDLWMQMLADVCNVEFATVHNSQAAGCLGDAMACTIATGDHPNWQEATNKMVKFNKVFKPIPENHEKYKFYQERYIETWPKVKDTIHAVVKHVNG